MLQQIRKFYTSPMAKNFVRNSFSKAFGKYLLATNIISSGVLLGVGDIVQQEIEYQRKKLPKRYDYERLGRMLLVGFAQGPMHHYFYKYLDKFLPGQDLKTIGKKILVDQFIASPLFIVSFFYPMATLEGKSHDECVTELKESFPAVYLTDWCVWPPTQYINFCYIPQQYRVVYINFITMLYDVFLSYVKHRNQYVTIKN